MVLSAAMGVGAGCAGEASEGDTLAPPAPARGGDVVATATAPGAASPAKPSAEPAAVSTVEEAAHDRPTSGAAFPFGSDVYWGAAGATDGRLMLEVFAQRSVDETRGLDLWFQVRTRDGAQVGERKLLVGEEGDEYEPSALHAGGDGKFLVVYTARRSGTGLNCHHDVLGVLVDASRADAAVSRPFLIHGGEGDQESARGVWIEGRQEAFVVYRTTSEVHGAHLSLDFGALVAKVGRRRPLIDPRPGYVAAPAVAYAPRTNRLLVAWGVMRTREDIELGTMSPDDDRLSIPDARTFRHKRRECAYDMAPSCIEGGDRPALAYNPTAGRFLLAIADDLADGSRVEAFAIEDTCSAGACRAVKLGTDDDTALPEDERERAIARGPRIGQVTVAPLGAGFQVAFTHGDATSYGPSRLGWVSVLPSGDAEAAATPANDMTRNRAVVMGAGAMVAEAQGGVLLFRYECGAADATSLCGAALRVGPGGMALERTAF